MGSKLRFGRANHNWALGHFGGRKCFYYQYVLQWVKVRYIAWLVSQLLYSVFVEVMSKHLNRLSLSKGQWLYMPLNWNVQLCSSFFWPFTHAVLILTYEFIRLSGGLLCWLCFWADTLDVLSIVHHLRKWKTHLAHILWFSSLMFYQPWTIYRMFKFVVL